MHTTWPSWPTRDMILRHTDVYSSAEIQVIGRDEANETGEAMRLGDLPGELQQAFVRGQC